MTNLNRGFLAGITCLSTLVAMIPIFAAPPADPSLAAVVEQVNQRMVKIYGSGGFRGLNSYGSGILVSADGHVLTAASPTLDTSGLNVHLSDGRRLPAKVLVTEPELDAALLKIDMAEDLPYYDVAQAARRPLATAGDGVLAFSNQFQIATREEAMSVQRGVIAAYARLHGKRGIFEAPYKGEVYIVDAITNNPGAAGGALTNRRGELLGLIGKELSNSLSDTYINYGVPIKVLAEFVDKGIKGQYKPIEKERVTTGPGGFHGIILVPNVVERTPPFIEDVVTGSPAARAGLRADDLVVYVDGEKVTSIKEFRDFVDRARPGTAFKLEVRRGDRLFPVDIKLEALPAPRKP